MLLMISTTLVACGGGSKNNNSPSPIPSSTASSIVSSVATSSVAISSSVPITASSSSSLSSSAESSSTSVSSSSSSSSIASAWVCPKSSLYFCDDFEANNSDKWDLLPDDTGNSLTPDGAFNIADDKGNYVLRYTAASKGGILALVKPGAFNGVTSADYYVEAKIRPRVNGTTSNKQLYIITRYVDGNNWYAGGLNVQGTTTSTAVELYKNVGGTMTRLTTVKRPLEMGATGTLEGVWYTVRVEMKGSVLTVYLDGETISTITDTTFVNQGLIGLWTANKSFEIDDIKVGDANQKPASLLISPSATSYAAEVGDAPRVISVTAKTEAQTEDTFTALSDNANVISVTKNGNSVSLTPLAVGTANITFTSVSKPELKRVVTATISPAFVMPTATYNLSGLTTPVVGSTNNYEDEILKLTFDSAPTLGSSGSVRIFKASDDSLVDTIKLSAESDSIGYGTLRTLNTKSIRVTGNTASISLHSNKLALGTTYYVAVSDSVFTGATLSGQTFSGIGKNTGWTFTTRAAAPATNLTSLTVDDTGNTAHFRTVQSALNYVMQNVTQAAAATITVKDGVYEELLYLRNKNNLTIVGESRAGTVIQYPNNEVLNSGSSGRPVFLVETADLLTLDTLTLKNTTLIGAGAQAEALYFNSPNGRLIAKNSNFISEQDTLQLQGWNWFYQSLIAGNVDFIWGGSNAALFEQSEIRTLGRSSGNANGGYLLQARVKSATDKGFVFLNSSLTSGEGPTGVSPLDGTHYLARSPGGTTTFDNIVFINTKMGKHIADIGWAGSGINSQPASNPGMGTATTGWREYGSMDSNGTTLDISKRQFGYQLSFNEIANSFCNRAQIFAAFNSNVGWDPMPSDVSNCGNVNTSSSSSNTSTSSSVAAESSAATSSVATSSTASKSSATESSQAQTSASESSTSSSQSSTPVANCDTFKSVAGFANLGNGTTGGAGGASVVVNNGVELVAALASKKNNTAPLIIYVNGTITPANSGSAVQFDVKDMANVSIIGVDNKGLFDGIGINIVRAQNIIVRNLTLRWNRIGQKDAISIDGDANNVSSNIWIDHNELYNDLNTDKDFYDELISGKRGTNNVTISYNYIHDSWKTSLWGYTDEDDFDRHITFAFNRWENANSRMPLFRHGHGHVYNNYYNNIDGTAINSRMDAQIRVDGNVFENSKNVIVSQDSARLGYWDTANNLYTNVTWSAPPSGNCNGTTNAASSPCVYGSAPGVQNGGEVASTTSYVPEYAYTLMPTSEVKNHVLTYAGVNKITACLAIPAISSSSSSSVSSSSVESSSSSSSSSSTTTSGWNGSAFVTGGSTTSASGVVNSNTDSTVNFSVTRGKLESSKDSFYFVSQDVTGDFTFIANLSQMSSALKVSSSDQYRVGIMLCADCSASTALTASANAQIGISSPSVTGTTSVVRNHRLTAGASINKTQTADVVSPNSMLYFKIVRVGTTYKSFYSKDGGVNYIDGGASDFGSAIGSTVKIGVFAAQGDSPETNTFGFENISLTQP
ncbi:MAG: hypothetical protein ABW044_11035 [Cellvibrio sp.]